MCLGVVAQALLPYVNGTTVCRHHPRRKIIIQNHLQLARATVILGPNNDSEDDSPIRKAPFQSPPFKRMPKKCDTDSEEY